MDAGKIIAGTALIAAVGIAAFKLWPNQKEDIPYGLKIVKYTNTRTGKVATAGNILICQDGDVVDVDVQFAYIGKAFVAKYHLATYVKTLGTINEVTSVEKGFSVEETPESTNVTDTISMVVHEGNFTEISDDHVYGLYLKIEGITIPESMPTYDRALLISEAGEDEGVITDLKIVSYTKTLNVGQTCTIKVGYNYIGPKVTNVVYAALGNQPPLGAEFDVMNSNTVEDSPNDTDVIVYREVSIGVVALESSPDAYDIEAKIGDKWVHADDKVLVSGSGSVQITDPSIYDWTTPVNVGQKCTITVKFNYQGPVTTLPLYVALGEDTIIPEFTNLVEGTIDVPIDHEVIEVTTFYASIDLTIPSATAAGGSPYDIRARIGGKDMNILTGKVVVNSNTGTLIISVNPDGAKVIVGGTEMSEGTHQIEQGTYGWSASANGYDSKSGTIVVQAGFTTNLVIVLVQTTGILKLSVTTTGTKVVIGGIEFTVGTHTVMVGTYDWVASKSGYSNLTGTVTIRSGQTTILNIPELPHPQVDIYPLTVAANSLVPYDYSGFLPNTYLFGRIDSGEDICETVSNSYGNGSGYFMAPSNPGTYKFYLKDYSSDIEAYITFYVEEGNGGGTQVGAVEIRISGYPSGTTFWGAQYYDPGFDEFVDLGTIAIGSKGYLNNIYPGGYLVVILYVDGVWTDWKYSNNFEPTNGSIWVYNWETNVIDFIYRP